MHFTYLFKKADSTNTGQLCIYSKNSQLGKAMSRCSPKLISCLPLAPSSDRIVRPFWRHPADHPRLRRLPLRTLFVWVANRRPWLLLLDSLALTLSLPWGLYRGTSTALAGYLSARRWCRTIRQRHSKYCPKYGIPGPWSGLSYIQQPPHPELHVRNGRNDVKSHCVGLVGETPGNKLEPRPGQVGPGPGSHARLEKKKE